jgi:hypothetical protein
LIAVLLVVAASIVLAACGGGGSSGGAAPPAPPTAPPADFDLVSPPDGTTDVILTPTLTWTASTEVATYTVQIDTNASFTTPIFEDTAVSGGATTYPVPAAVLSAGTSYFWRVEAVNALGTTEALNAPFSFTTGSVPSGGFTLQTPADGAINQPVTPTLTWNDATGETSYTVQIATDDLFTAIVHETTAVAADATSYLVPASTLAFSTQYFWRVIAVNGIGSLVASNAPFDFTTSAPNTAPVAVNDAYDVAEDGTLNEAAPGVLVNDTDADGPSPLTAVLDVGPTNGTLTLNADGSFDYVPDADFDGVDSFTYMAFDGVSNSNVATVTLTINPTNEDAPIADGQGVGTMVDTAISIFLTGSDPDTGDTVTLFRITSLPGDGTLEDSVGTVLSVNDTIAGAGPVEVVYIPDTSYVGYDEFTFQVDSDGASPPTQTSADATVAITVFNLRIPNPTPVVDEGFGRVVAVLDNDGDDTGDQIVIGAPQANDPGNNNSGAVHVHDATTGALDFTISNPTGAKNERFGSAVVVIGDIGGPNGLGSANPAWLDGVPDIAIGAPRAAVGATKSAGIVYVFDGTGTRTSYLLRIQNPSAVRNDQFGAALAPLDDVNSDSIPDFAVGDPLDNSGTGKNNGRVFIVSGANGGILNSFTTPDDDNGDNFGAALASVPGDILVVGAPFDEDPAGTGTANAGVVYVYTIGAGGAQALRETLENPEPTTDLSLAPDEFGSAIAVWDVDGANGVDIVVGSPMDDPGGTLDAGAAYLFLETGTAYTYTTDTLTRPVPVADDQFGAAVCISDIEVLVGAPNADPGGIANAGSVFVFDNAGAYILEVSNPEPAADDNFGAAIAADTDTDPLSVVAIGAPMDDYAGADTGTVYVP